MNTCDEEMISNKPKYLNCRHIFFSIVIYLALSQIINIIIPSKYLNEYLVSHTIASLLMPVAIYYLSLLYNPQPLNTSSFNNLIFYCLGGTILCVIINFPHVSFNSHIKAKEYSIFISYGAVAKLYFLVMLCVVGPIIEEIYCRRYIYNMIKDDFNITTGIIVSSFLYMILHERIDFLYLFVPGVIYAVVYEKTKTIWSSIIVHGLNNLIWFSLVYY